MRSISDDMNVISDYRDGDIHVIAKETLDKVLVFLESSLHVILFSIYTPSFPSFGLFYPYLIVISSETISLFLFLIRSFKTLLLSFS
mmetsp:Transcript_23344/g.23274  ORF Transcript_23344/g.23274 Transcript_23344/m.23274 type:complete len:87 (+) Transcript_23344:488-748(+)